MAMKCFAIAGDNVDALPLLTRRLTHVALAP
jgi:hypothetical protein